ncbi:MAG: hypothetical protein SOX97_05300 [Sutterella sp.]|nr:hypothetical protein [Sutterella sp.]
MPVLAWGMIFGGLFACAAASPFSFGIVWSPASAGAYVTERIMPGVVVLHHGAWFDPQNLEEGRIDVHGNSNTLTMDVPTSSLACGNIASTALVEVTKWTKPLPRVSVCEQPPRAA